MTPPAPKVALISEDSEIIERVAHVVGQAHAILEIAGTVDHAAAMLASQDYVAKLLDRTSTLVPRACPACTASKCERCPVVNSVVPHDTILLLVQPEPPRRYAARSQAYSRAALEALLNDVRALLPAREVALGDSAILGNTLAIRLVREQVRSVASYREVSVLILGETGTGKELVAEEIHRLSHAPDRPFIAVNCAAIPEQLLESELFGHEAGAFTGARTPRIGLAEAANGGTLFLDEVTEMPLATQAKLLRVLETRRFRRLGSNQDRPLDARVVSATNRLSSLSAAHLRPDLLYRLAGFTISLPPLRERVHDIETLAREFLQAFSKRHNLDSVDLTEDALELLRGASWPGNVRELRAVLDHAAIVSTAGTLDAEHIRVALAQMPRLTRPSITPPSEPKVPVQSNSLRDFERDLIVRAWADHGHNLTRAARALDLPRSTLRDKLRKLGLR
ncbi:MAG: sigma-54 dependent transcriptional regulator [Polyangiaceae bacterium]